MRRRIKVALLLLSAGLVALNAGACFFRWFGDFLGDALWLRNNEFFVR
jgi:hypothetical protein